VCALPGPQPLCRAGSRRPAHRTLLQCGFRPARPGTRRPATALAPLPDTLVFLRGAAPLRAICGAARAPWQPPRLPARELSKCSRAITRPAERAAGRRRPVVWKGDFVGCWWRACTAMDDATLCLWANAGDGTASRTPLLRVLCTGAPRRTVCMPWCWPCVAPRRIILAHRRPVLQCSASSQYSRGRHVSWWQ
jgi:hypothetical protein